MHTMYSLNIVILVKNKIFCHFVRNEFLKFPRIVVIKDNESQFHLRGGGESTLNKPMYSMNIGMYLCLQVPNHWAVLETSI